MAREYFCAYHSYLPAIRKLSDAECGRLFRALLSYSAGGEPINLQGREELVFDIFSQQIDRDNAQYEKKCEKNRLNAALANGSERKRTVANAPQEKEEDKEKEKEDKSSKKVSPNGDKKESKHKFGEYGHVLLTDSEYEKLQNRFPDSYQQKIAAMDKGIEMKGYKYKSHYLAILKWAENDSVRQPKGGGSGNPFLDMLKEG